MIDVGSNTARLDVFEVGDGGDLRAVFESKEVPRLGEGVGADGRISPAAIERGMATLKRFAREIEAWGRPQVVAVATSAIRDAANGKEFVDRVQRETGLTLKVVPGEEEARLAYLGTAAAWPLGNDAIADVGGGSIQIALARDGSFGRGYTAPLGVLRLKEQFLTHDPPKRRELEKLRGHIRQSIESLHLPRLRSRSTLYGIGGTIRCLARVAILLTDYPVPQVHGFPLRRRDLDGLESITSEMTAEQLRDVPGVSGHRSDLIVAGIILADELLRDLGLDEMTVSGNGIRQGLATEMAGIPVPASAETLARRSVLASAKAFSFSIAHADDVRTTAIALFDLLKSRRRWTDTDRVALSVGAWMHDVGIVVEEWRHPVHSAYILRHTSVHGLRHREILLASLAAYLHEGDPAPDGWQKAWKAVLTPGDVLTAREFGSILAVAETVAGLGARFRRGRGAGKLRMTLKYPTGTAARSRIVDRLSRRLRRDLGLELEVPRA